MFLYGGNDGNNMVVPYDDYGSYAAGRSGATGAAIGRGELVPIAPTGLPRYGLHPNLSALAPLFEQGKLAVVANVGALTAPLTRADYLSGKPHPRNLFSHSDQQSTWQGLVPGQADHQRMGRPDRRRHRRGQSRRWRFPAWFRWPATRCTRSARRRCPWRCRKTARWVWPAIATATPAGSATTR